MALSVPPSERAASASDADRTLQARLLDREPAAPSDLALAHLGPLVASISARFPNRDDHLLIDVCIDLILSLAEKPEQYNPDRAGLAQYLRMAAYRDVQNALRGEGRRTRRLVAFRDVELAEAAGNRFAESPNDPAEVMIREQPTDPSLLLLVREAFDKTERDVLELMLDGERRTAVYAAVLGLGQRSELEQAHEVKRVKDRLSKRLRRLAPKVPRDD